MIDWHEWRKQFPVTEKYIYLNHAGIAPLPLRVHRAMAGFLDDATNNGAVNSNRWEAAAEACRAGAARLLKGGTDEIAFMKNTSQGIIIAANGIDWRGPTIVAAYGGGSGRFVDFRHGRLCSLEFTALSVARKSAGTRHIHGWASQPRHGIFTAGHASHGTR